MQRIDSHAHFFAGDRDIHFLKQRNIKVLNICIAGLNRSGWRQEEVATYSGLAEKEPNVFAWCTSFASPDPKEKDRDYADRVLSLLEQDFAHGAIAAKVWKNVGMEDKDDEGRYRLISDPVFQPVFDYLEREGHPCVIHTADPLACWQPLTRDSPHYGYYSQYAEWYMFGRTDVPSHAELMAARDLVLERHPRLRVIGAHLGSMEHDLREVAHHLDRYPNFVVDTAARLADLAWQDPSPVRQFFEHYQDRLLWGTDFAPYPKPDPSAVDQEKGCSVAQQTYDTEWSYFTRTDDVTVLGRTCRGLGLPDAICEKFFHHNAQQWYPGI